MTGAIEAVVFDVDGTMYDQSRLRRAMLLRLIRAYALHPLQGRQVARVIRAYRRAQEELRESKGVDPALQQATVAAGRTGLATEEVERITMRWLEHEPLRVLARYRRTGLVETLAALRADGVRLGVVSDYPADDKLTALGIRQFFDVVVSAQDSDVGAFKPNPRGLQVCLARLGVAAANALYVGDRPETDAAAAQSSDVSCVIIGSRAGTNAADHVSITAFAQLLTECARS
ncbi:MAG: HAD family hydrolase [Acidimicrobiales bacterium]